MTTTKAQANLNTNKAQFRISVAVISSYAFKACIKLTGGVMFSMPPLVADGIHSCIDILEHGAIVLAGRHARKPDRDRYPLDREPLIELIGLFIFLGLFFVGLNFLSESIKAITAVMVEAGWIWIELPLWITKLLPQITLPNVSILWIVALLLFLCYFVTEVVYRFQIRLAKEYKLREMEDDAKELRSDGWLELSMGLGFAAGWIVIHIIKTTSSSELAIHISALLTSIILFSVSIYLVTIAIPEIYKKYQNIMNVALNRKKRNELEKNINARLPKRCAILNPITAFYRGEQLYISGRIRIDRSLMVSADIVLAKAERTAQQFLSNLSDDIRVQFSPIFLWDSESIELDFNNTLRLTWSVPPFSQAAQAFRFLRKGRINKAQKIISDDTTTDKNEIALASYVNGECSLRINGPYHQKTQHYAEIIENLLSQDLPLPIKTMFASWILIYTTDRSKNSESEQPTILEARERLENLSKPGVYIPDIVRAEAEFALGFSWERCHQYDLRKCTDHYKQSEAYYIQSGIRSESDRLMNTWGHLETLIYALGDAQDHLGEAHKIKKIRNDSLGLSFTYGCLGDLYSRLGKFDEAENWYSLDIDLLTTLGDQHHIPLVTCKQGESRIRGGLTLNNSKMVLSGIQLCEDSSILAGGENRQGQFFAKKGQLKGWLGLSSNLFGNKDLSSYRQKSAKLLEVLDAKNNYETAYTLRLNGRFHGLFGDIEESRKCLNESAFCFDRLKESRYEIALRLQSIACRLEILRHEIANDVSPVCEISPVDELENFLKPYGGMLGNAAEIINKQIEIIRKNSDRKTMKKEETVINIDRLVWFVEG